MSRKYQPSSGHHKRGPKSGGIKNPIAAPRCRCGKNAIRVDDECAKCGRWLPDAH